MQYALIIETPDASHSMEGWGPFITEKEAIDHVDYMEPIPYDENWVVVELQSPGGDIARDEAEFGELEVVEFKKDADANLPEGVKRLDGVGDGVLIVDAAGSLFTVVGYGPVQGSVEIVDDDGIHAYYDGGTYVRESI